MLYVRGLDYCQPHVRPHVRPPVKPPVPFRVQAKRTRISYELFPMVVFRLLTGNEARPYYVQFSS